MSRNARQRSDLIILGWVARSPGATDDARSGDKLMNVRRQLALMAAMAGLCCGTGATVADPAPGGSLAPSRVSLAYEVYTGGFHILAVDLNIGIAPDRYDVIARLRTTQWLSWLIDWQQVSRSTGLLVGVAVEPLHHWAHGELRGRERRVAIDYADGRVAGLAIDPPPGEDEDREEVSAALRDGTLDPLSAILAMVRAVSDGRGCNGRAAVFDGRRRYDLVFTDRGIRPMPESPYVAASAATRECDFVYEPIAGDVRRPADSSQDRKLRSGRAWIPPAAPGALAAPMRVELDGNWGTTTAYLRDPSRVGRPEPRSGSPLPPTAPNTP